MRSLLNDPTSWLQASVARWTHPVSWDTLALFDLFDLWSDEKHRHPRPWDKQKNRSSLTASEAAKILKK